MPHVIIVLRQRDFVDSLGTGIKRIRMVWEHAVGQVWAGRRDVGFNGVSEI